MVEHKLQDYELASEMTEEEVFKMYGEDMDTGEDSIKPDSHDEEGEHESVE